MRNDFCHTLESTLKWFHCYWVNAATNFCICSASDQILTIFSWASDLKLSQRRMNFIAVWVNWKTISSLTESTRKWFYHWLSQCRNDFFVDWVFQNYLCRTGSEILLHPATQFLSLELGIYELLTASIQAFLARSYFILASSSMQIAILSSKPSAYPSSL